MLAACGEATTTAPAEEVVVRPLPAEIQAFARRHHLQQPQTPADKDQAQKWSFESDGRVQSTGPLSSEERAVFRAALREALRTRTGVGGSLPSAGTGEAQLPGPSFAGFGDTTFTVEVSGTTLTLESVTSSGWTVITADLPGNLAIMAGWASFTVSGDSTEVTSVFVQTYDNTEILDEGYLPGGDLGDLNEEIAETAPFEPANFSPLFSCTTAKWRLFTGALAAIAWSIVTYYNWWNAAVVTFTIGRYVEVVAAVADYACQCKNDCWESSPPPGLNEASIYRSLTAPRAQQGTYSLVGFWQPTCSITRGVA